MENDVKDAELTSEDFDALLDRFIESEHEKARKESALAPDEGLTGHKTVKTKARKESALAPLERLTGLKTVKTKLKVYEQLVGFNLKRAENNLPVVSLPLHAMFLGSPGTGKTTVAKLMGEMLARAGVLSSGHVVVRERSMLVGTTYGSEEKSTLDAIKEAEGGILLIDEAYQLYQPEDTRDPGRFVIETLMTALADESHRNWMLILAGYPDNMRRMFEMNPGLRSRIPESNVYVFEDFTESELMEIADRYFEESSYVLTPCARRALADRLRADHAARDSSFGNARYVINMIQTEIIPAMAQRVMSMAKVDFNSLRRIHMADIPSAARPVVQERSRIGYCA